MGEYELVYAIGNNSYTRKVKVLSVEDVYYTEVGEYTHTITASGNYKITVSGAQGVKGGKGGTIIGKITLTKGTILNLVVGGQNALYGGGVGESNGGDSSRVSLNGEVIMIGAGGGGGASGTAGGSGNGGGGADQGNGAGNSGTTGGGGGASYNYTYLNECYTGSPNECVGGYKNGSCQTYNSCVNNSCSCKTRNSCASSSCGCKTYRSCVNSNCSCDVMFPRPSTKCKTYDSCRHKVCGCQTYNSCANDSCSCKTRNSCANSSCGCKTYNQVWDSCKSTQNTCESKTITTNGKSGNGGTNLISALLTNVNNTAGNNSQNGKIIIEYIK